MAKTNADNEFNSLLFEKKLQNLKDSQESINTCCHWCLENRQHHKKIVSAWLNVLKRVKVEHRLTLFYLANDVIQYSKRRNYEFVESWGTSLQKATTLVRDEKVKHKILRIFKIWEQRGIYGEEFIGDLSGLISATPPARKNDEPHEFESQYLITKIRNCAKLEADTDEKQRKFKEHNPKILEGESMFSSLKDRAHVDDVEKEMDEYVKHMEAYINSLKNEIKARNHLISLLVQADNQLDKDKKDVKLVANAYKTFATRVKNLKKKLEELKPTLSSPIPSPDINAPSPSPDSDDGLGDFDNQAKNTSLDYSAFANPGFYNPVPPPTSNENTNDFPNNGFSSFMGGNIPFNLQNLNNTLFATNTNSNNSNASSNYSTNSVSNLFQNPVPPPPPAAPGNQSDFPYNPAVPLMPPPIPPFSKSDTGYGTTATYTDSYNPTTSTNFGTNSYEPPIPSYATTVPQPYQPSVTNFQTQDSSYRASPATAYAPANSNFNTGENNFSSGINYPPPSVNNNFPGTEEYNPEEEPETWENDASWDAPSAVDLETPESPPIFEKEGFNDPVEYHDIASHGTGVDMDHRVIPSIPDLPLEDKIGGHRKKDVDHRNLISLTGSPREVAPNSGWKPCGKDQDYRTPQKTGPGGPDQDYRVPFNIENLKLPPPPPPPKQISPIKMANNSKKLNNSPRKLQDKVEIIDMELSDDESTCNDNNTSLKMIPVLNDSSKKSMLEPPPPLPDLPEDVDANNLLDDISSELNEFVDQDECDDGYMGQGPPGYGGGFENPPWSNIPPPPNMPDMLRGMADMNNMMDMGNMPMLNMGMGPMGFPFRGRGGRPNGNRGHIDFRGRGRSWGFRGPNPRGRGGNWNSPRGLRGNLPRGRPFFRGNNFRGSF